MISFGTLKKKSAFKMYARAMNMNAELANEISKQIGEYDEAYKMADDDEKSEIDIYDFVDKEYHSYLTESKKYWGIISDKKKAPCAYLIYQGDIRSEIGLIKCKSESTKKEYITTVTDGAIAEKYKFLKNDLLKVDVVLLINNLYNRIGIPHHTVNELTNLVKDNEKVWDIYGKGITIGINQCEKESTTKKAVRFKPKNISELAAFIAAIRPAFKSMYSKFETREHFEYGIKAFDNILQTPEFPQSFILYQEQTMNTLNYAGFPIDQCYGIIKAIAKKHPEKVKPLKSKFIEGFKQRIITDDNVDNDTAEEMSAKVWQIISDSCGYGFNSAHAYCMALDSLYCAYLKSHYPYEFYEVLLQHYSDKGDKDKVLLLKKEMKKFFNIEEGSFKYGQDNRKFIADKENLCIIPAVTGIKGLSNAVGEELYRMGKENLSSFFEICEYFRNSKILNKGHAEILIGIDYFSQFGTISKIKKFYTAFDRLYDKKQFSKNNIPDEYYEIIVANSVESKSLYKDFDYKSALYEYWNMIDDKDNIKLLINNQSKYLGYINYICPDMPDDIYYVSDFKVFASKSKPYVTLYQLNSGESIKTKVTSSEKFIECPFNREDIIKVEMTERQKMQRVEGKWVKTGETEPVMNIWEVI